MTSPPQPSPARALGHGGSIPLCQKAEQMLTEALDRQRREVEELLERCESPIEQVMLVSLWSRWPC